MDGLEIQCWRVRNWNRHFENNRTRELKRMDWVPMPNKHDGDGFTDLMDHANGMAHYGAWALIAQVAAKCDPRGTLLRDYRTRVRDGAESIKAYDFESLARVTRGSVKVFEEAIPRLISIGWLEVITISPDGSSELSRTVVRDERQNPAGKCDPSVPFHSVQFPSVPGEGGGGGNPKTEVINSHAILIMTHARVALVYLNEKAGKHFREIPEHLSRIAARLKSPGVDIDGVKKMIDRQVALWTGTERAEYLRPETLFGKEKFAGYYDARELSIPKDTNAKPNPRNQDCTGDHEQIAKRVAAEVDRRQNRPN